MAHKNIYNTHNRYKSRNRSQFRQLIGLSVAFGTLFFLGLVLGRSNVENQSEALTTQIKEKTAQVKTLEEELMLARANAQTIEARYQQLQNDVLKELPFDGPLRDLIEELRARLDGGVNPERLSFAIKAARPPQNCSDPQVKRFVVSTPNYQGPDSQVEIKGGVSVSGAGVVAKNKEGSPEAWYNPAKPVTITMKADNGKKKSKKRTLPFSDTMIVNGKEYRFTFSEGTRSFVKVTYDFCDYP